MQLTEIDQRSMTGLLTLTGGVLSHQALCYGNA